MTETLPASSVRHNLRTDRTPLFGRDRDIELVAELTEANRLVSLLGIGGTGKTRLAIAVGREVLSRFPDGVWFVDLVPVADTRSIVTAIADAAGLALARGAGADDSQTTSLFRQLRSRIGLDEEDPLGGSTLAEIDGAARAWMIDQVRESG